jgi:sulfofructosephosphate aldolase
MPLFSLLQQICRMIFPYATFLFAKTKACFKHGAAETEISFAGPFDTASAETRTKIDFKYGFGEVGMTEMPQLTSLARPSGGFAMLAIDQRESLRAMFAETQNAPVKDIQLTDFKMEVLRQLTPFASAVLIDRDFAWRQAIDGKVVAPACGLIAAADRFIPSRDEIVSQVEIDDAVDPATMREDGASALKLLVPWRPDEPSEPRIAMVEDFITRCRKAGLLSIIEPVSRKRRDGGALDLFQGIIEAAQELGALGADLYKAEVPRHGTGGEAAVRRDCARLTDLIKSPWVVLSSGVAPDDFPRAVEWACLEGASGFLAGRAVWRHAVGRADMGAALRDDALPRLLRLGDVVDRALAARG